jgi:hypothetical protein
MKIEWAEICRYAESGGAGLIMVGGNLDVVVAPTLPAQIPMALVVKIGGINDLPSIDQITLRLISPSGNLVFESQMGLAIELRDNAAVPEGMKLSQSVVAGIALTAEEHGVYRFSVEATDRSSYEVTIAVVTGT